MIKKITENPKVTDAILFEIETPDGTNCFSSNPFKVDNVTIYYVERDFLGSNFGEYDVKHQNQKLVKAVESAQAAVCDDPSEVNMANLAIAQNELESTTQITKWYFKERTPVHIVGEGTTFPAWLSTDVDNAALELVDEDEDGNPQFGHFTYTWQPDGKVREGDYFICWTWTPLPAGEKLSAHLPFKIFGDTKATTTIPTHVTEEGKYEVLLEKYLPEMYKAIICEGDLTPESTDKLNLAVAGGFTALEDLANQIIDLFDANALHESMLKYLSNLFDIRLRSGDPTLWRRQIKEAIPLFKKKGTMPGLEAAFKQSGIKLDKFTQFWQMVSPCTWQESFRVDGTDDIYFELEKDNIVLPINDTNFGLWIRAEDDDDYTELSKDYVDFSIGEDCIVTMTWIGDQLSSSPITLIKGDIVRVLYEYKECANQTHEDYIRALPLQDLRDEGDIVYPPKNWNVRLIDEEDPMFDVLIPVRHPYHEPIVFGFIRTEFPYSENIYNMEEYNGSTRPSFDACNIDRNFRDPCGACLSSSYMVDVSIEELNNDRLIETQDILAEFMPFHAELYAINFSGEVDEFVQSPVEKIEALITIDYLQNHLSGQYNYIWSRHSDGVFSSLIPDRDDLADKVTVLSGKLGTGYNNHVRFIAPDVDVNSLAILDSHNVLEVMAPSVNAGEYLLAPDRTIPPGADLNHEDNHTIRVDSDVTEPLDQTEFTFNLSNVYYSTHNATITQNDLFEFSDSSVDFAELGVKTQWDATHTPDYTGGAWKVLLSTYDSTAYEIVDIEDGVLILDGNDNLPITDTTGISYTLLTDTDSTVDSNVGDLNVTRRGHVDLNDHDLVDRENFIWEGDYLVYDDTEYLITGFTDQDKLWIADWTDGDVAGANINTRRRLVESGTGLFGYKGLHLVTFSDHETEFEVINGSNPPSGDQPDEDNFKENYMFKIGNDFYRIEEWDGSNVVISGREQDWTTLDAGGTAVAYSIVHFPKKQVNVKFTVFDHLDRDGKDVIIREILDQVDENVAVVALSNNPSSGIEDNVASEESVSFIIETPEGQIEEGEL